MYRLCPFSILQLTQESNISEEVQQYKDVYQEKIRFKELCPHVCNSVEEFLLIPLLFDCGAGKAPGMFCGAVVALEVFCGVTVALVLFSL